MAALPINQAELVQPPSMLEKQSKVLKSKAEKKVKVESPAAEGSPVQTQPAQTIEGTFLLITVTYIRFLEFYKCDGDFRRFSL